MTIAKWHVVWLSRGDVSALGEVKVAADEAVIAMVDPGEVDAVGRILHADPRIAHILPADERAGSVIAPLVERREIATATILRGSKLQTQKFNKSDKRPNLSGAYQGWQAMRAAGLSGIDVRGAGWRRRIPGFPPLSLFAGKHQGERIYVLGNGPSLADVAPERLRSAVTIGSNGVHLAFKRWGFPVTYWMCEDRLQIETELEMHKAGLPDSVQAFLPFEYAATAQMPSACFYPLIFSDGQVYADGVSYPAFSPSLDGFRHGFTVTVSMIQLAVLMGAREIVLLGLDHSYGLQDNRTGLWTATESSTQTHFDPAYTEGDRQFVRPRPVRAEQAYRAARDWCEQNGVRIINATPKSALTVFETGVAD